MNSNMPMGMSNQAGGGTGIFPNSNMYGPDMNMMGPYMYNPMFKINELEQEVTKLKSSVNCLEKRVSLLEENKRLGKNSGKMNSGVSNNDGSIYMI